MTDMTETPKSDLDKIPTQKNLVSDSFVIEMDLESFVHGGNNKESSPNSRITLQRSLSRKGSMRSNSSSITNDSFVSSTPSSPGGSPEKLKAVAEGLLDPSSNPQVHHQMITVTSSAATESRFSLRRNSFKRSPLPWTLDPKRILLLFATLSSMGSILLIYFTLSICGTNLDVNALD